MKIKRLNHITLLVDRHLSGCAVTATVLVYPKLMNQLYNQCKHYKYVDRVRRYMNVRKEKGQLQEKLETG